MLSGIGCDRPYSITDLRLGARMSLLATILRLLLSLIFAAAGITKALDPPGTRRAVIDFGATEGLAGVIAAILPVAELLIATGLLFSEFARISGIAALVLLALFVAAIAWNLYQGKTPECHCFGQIYSRPLGWPTLIRNAIFALMAATIVSIPPASSIDTARLINGFTLGPQYSAPLALLLAGLGIAALILGQLKRRRP